MECQIRNSLVVGTITSLIGTIALKMCNPEKEINILKYLIIFFIVGVIVHIILESFNFNSYCYDKKCYGDLCRGNICNI